jgi:hypothetical protein
VEVYSRKADPDKVDLVSALVSPTDQEKTIAFFRDVVALSLLGNDVQIAQDWVKVTIPTLTNSGESAERMIGDVKLKFDVLGENVRLNIGGIQ